VAAEVPHRHVVYKLYGADADLLYVGSTTDLAVRFYQHSVSAPWWPEVLRLEVEEHPNRAVMLDAEKRLVQELHPPYNTKHRIPRHDTPLRALPDGTRYLTPRDLSEKLAVSLAWVRDCIDKGDLGASRDQGGSTRVAESDLRKFLEERRTHPPNTKD
jgi:excisionase family DNA binding protein